MQSILVRIIAVILLMSTITANAQSAKFGRPSDTALGSSASAPAVVSPPIVSPAPAKKPPVSREIVEQCVKKKKGTPSDGAAPKDTVPPGFVKVSDAERDQEMEKMLKVAEGDFDSLRAALNYQVGVCDKQKPIQVGGQSIPASRYCEATNKKMSGLLDQYRKETPGGTFGDFQRSIAGQFDWYKMDCKDEIPQKKKRQRGGVLFTSYNSPKIQCIRSTKPEGDFKYPVRRTPGQPPIAYTKNLFDLYILGIEGSGACVFGDESEININYDSSNGEPNPLMSKVLKCMEVPRGDCQRSDPPEDCAERDQLNIPEMREYFTNNSAKLDEALSYIASVPYFKTVDAPKGALGFPVSNRHSAAIPKGVPLGMVMMVQSWRPEENPAQATKNFSSLLVGQDRGGAIKGCRIDWYSGVDDRAKAAAGTMSLEKGTVLIAVAK